MITFAVLLSGCELGKNNSDAQDTMVVERPGVTIKGKLSFAGDKFFISSQGKSTEVASKKINLTTKVGQEVEIYGEFSGTTLYADEVK